MQEKLMREILINADYVEQENDYWRHPDTGNDELTLHEAYEYEISCMSS